MKVAVILAISMGVLAIVKAQEEVTMMKATKLPLAEMEEEPMMLPEARDELSAQPDQMQRRGGKGGDSPPPPPPPGWGWGPPPMPMGWGWGGMGGMGGPPMGAGYGR